jgi:hypothetical protein
MYYPTLSSAVTRRIWCSPDAILLFFAGGAAEFAAIKAVDWLFFTGRLPEAPVERLFETVRFARGVFFADPAGATEAVERINRIHRRVEEARGEDIPQWAYRDMLFILIDYGERAHGVVFGAMTEAERASHFGVALALGRAMRLGGLPTTYEQYRDQRHRQLLEDYARGPLTEELYASYRRALGPLRYRLLQLVQASVLPEELRGVLRLEPNPLVEELLSCYRFVPGGATSCAPYTASCYLASSLGNCARWNACQLPDSNFILWSALGCAGGGRRDRMPTTFKWAHASWDNAESNVSRSALRGARGAWDRSLDRRCPRGGEIWVG